jgi:hypothetical protein
MGPGAANSCDEVIVNDKCPLWPLFWVSFIIVCQHGCPAPTRYPFANSVSTSKANEHRKTRERQFNYFSHAAFQRREENPCKARRSRQ